jgi:hypothetical protein
MEKIWVIAGKHDESLLALYQSCINYGLECLPAYLYSWETYEQFKSLVQKNDSIIFLHSSGGTEVFRKIGTEIDCKKILNKKIMQNYEICKKSYQQKVVSETYPDLVIPTYTTEFPDDLEFPVFIKPDSGSCGEGARLAYNVNELNLQLHEIAQPYIKNSGDWRVIVIGGKAVSAIKRLPSKAGYITNNISTGSFAIVETDKEVLDNIYKIAESISNIFGFDYVGIDIIYDTQNEKYLFLEVNEMPTFEASQMLSGINISNLIIENLLS